MTSSRRMEMHARTNVSRVDRVPHEIADGAGGGQGDHDLAICLPPQELRLCGHNSAPGFEFADHERVQGQTAPLHLLAPETAYFVGEYPGVVFPPPLAVGNVVQASPFLHADDRQNCIVQQPVGILLTDTAAHAVLNHVLQPSGPGQTAHHHGGKKRVVVRFDICYGL